MNGVFNFRDLGGLETEDGRKIKKGLFFRSGYLDNADSEDIAYLKSLGLKVVFDYRDNEEVDPAHEVVYESIGAKHRHYPNKITKGAVYKLQVRGVSRAFMKIKPSDVQEFYSYLPLNNAGYKAMAKSLKEGEVPFLQHCTAGKDRAGTGSAILLSILGVPYDTIIKDYLESLKIYGNIRGVIFDRIPKAFHHALRNNYEPLFIVDKSYLDAAKDAVIKKYGSLEKYYLEEFGLSDKDIEDIKNRYLE